jgi:hypothetical protein
MTTQQSIRKLITGISWYKVSENAYLGGDQEGIINYNDQDGRTRSFNSVVLLGNGSVHRQNLDDLTPAQWGELYAEATKKGLL